MVKTNTTRKARKIDAKRKAEVEAKKNITSILSSLNDMQTVEQNIFLENARELNKELSSEISHYEELSVLKLGFVGVVLAALIGVCLMSCHYTNKSTYISLLLF